MITRRDYLIYASLFKTGTMMGAPMHQASPSAAVGRTAPSIVNVEKLARFADPLPIPTVLRAGGTRPNPANKREKLPYYRVPMQPVLSKVHRDLPPTRFWGYGGSVPGPTIEVRSGEGALIDWPNELPTRHMFAIDHNLMGAERDKPEVRTVVHLHGAKAPPISDGYPENWYTPGRSAVYRYPNEQDAAMLWYHDHAMGINRLNMMAGLFGLYIIRDAEEEKLELPGGPYEIPLVLFDRMLTHDGQLYYPVSTMEKAPWVPEFFGNAFLVNGKVLPYLAVEPRPYRFRVLNVSNGRFYNLSLSNGEPFLQIGTDGGLLSSPVSVPTIRLAPAERADVIVDFTAHRNEEIVLREGVQPVMQFRVGKDASSTSKPIPKTLRLLPKVQESEAVRTRYLTLEENVDVLDAPMIHLLNGARWHDPVTEQPEIGTTEIWAFINLTEDSHPIHLHLVRFRILDRRSFDDVEYLAHKKIRYTDDAQLPSPGEMGWKDTVQAHPKMVTRVLIPFEGYTGRYVWHCHILEHEDNEMMRPFDVVPASTKSASIDRQ